MYLIHYYVQRGFDWDKIINATPREKEFLMASMALAFDEEAEKYNAILGGNGQ